MPVEARGDLAGAVAEIDDEQRLRAERLDRDDRAGDARPLRAGELEFFRPHADRDPPGG